MTLQAFKGHRLHHVLDAPGTADLTADVDFSYLRRMAGAGVACLGPLPQREFLKNMGIDTRMQASVWGRHPAQRCSEGAGLTARCSVQVLLRNCTDASTRKQLISSYDMLTSPARMGQRFHFFSLLQHSRLVRAQVSTGLKLEKRSPAQLPVAGFSQLSLS